MSVNEALANGNEATLSVENGKAPVSMEKTPVESPADSSTDDASLLAAVAAPSVVQADGSKKSFASIVSARSSFIQCHELTCTLNSKTILLSLS